MILELQVQPGASRSEFAGRYGDRIKVRLAARAFDGKAERSVRILSGLKSRHKRVEII